MFIPQAIVLGLSGNGLSKKITGTDEVCAGRTAVATGAGAALGAVVATGVVPAPIVVPLALGAAAVGFIASLFD